MAETKCSGCKGVFIPEEKKDGQLYKVCLPCREKFVKKCPHNKVRSRCKDCGGGSICEHNKRRSQCKECGGSAICEHNKQRSTCKECKGSSICEHNKQRSTCKDCKGSSICEHNKQRSQCKECGGGSICEHNKRRSNCKDCGGGSICEHNKQRSQCKDCGGGSICEHNKRRSTCIICKPELACENCKYIYVKYGKYKPYCFRCYCVLNPDEEISRKFKLRETFLKDHIINNFPDCNWVCDKIVEEGCSRRRPDFLLDMGLFSLILECVETQHNGESYSCENKRMMELFQDLGNRPLVMVRFNPDNYVSKEEEKIKSCFETSISGVFSVVQEEWERRVKKLDNIIRHFMRKSVRDKKPMKEVTIIKLFYDKFQFD